MAFRLRSPAFADGSPIPEMFSHDRGDLSPALNWDDVPDGTVELVLLVDDPDAPIEGSFVHWVLFGLDPTRRGLAEGETPAEAISGANGFSIPGYLGPAPPAGDLPHRYVFRLLAVTQPIHLDGLPGYRHVSEAAEEHLAAEARLVGTYQSSAR